MPIDPAEAVSLVSDATDFAAELVRALQRDQAGKVRIDKAERQRLLNRLARLTTHLMRDALD